MSLTFDVFYRRHKYHFISVSDSINKLEFKFNILLRK